MHLNSMILLQKREKARFAEKQHMSAAQKKGEEEENMHATNTSVLRRGKTQNIKQILKNINKQQAISV